MPTHINRDEWLKALNQAGIPTESDEQALTVEEFAAMMDIPRTTATYRLGQLIKAGRAVLTHKRALTAGGKWVMHRAYRLTS